MDNGRVPLKQANHEYLVYHPAVPPYSPREEREPHLNARTGCVKMIPFLRWPGGKRWLVDMYPNVFPKSYSTYIEPFLGAGSVYFHLQPGRATLGDLNGDVIAVYRGIKQDAGSVQALLEQHYSLHCREYYYEIREIVPGSGCCPGGKDHLPE